jgi:hypothetical protein
LQEQVVAQEHPEQILIITEQVVLVAVVLQVLEMEQQVQPTQVVAAEVVIQEVHLAVQAL